MADIHLKGSSGNNANNGSTWALAKATMEGAMSVAAAGDRILCDASASENTGSTTLAASGGGVGGPLVILSGTPDVTTGLTALSAGYTYKVSGGTFDLHMSGFGYVQGVTLIAGTSTNATVMKLLQGGDNMQTFDNCDFRIESTASSCRIEIGISSSTDGGQMTWKNCDAYFSHASQTLQLRNCEFHWTGGSILSGGATPSTLFGTGSAAGRGVKIRMTGVDLSNMGSSFNFLASPAGTIDLVVRGCKLPSSWSGSLMSGSGSFAHWRAEMHDCDTANNGYVRFLIKDRYGEAVQETTIKRTGSGDGIADYSIKATGVSGGTVVPSFPSHGFAIHEQAIWNSATGSSKTLTVEIAANSALTNKEVVLRARYYSSTGAPLLTQVTSEPTVLASAAAPTSSSETWGGSPSNKYKLTVSFTPQRAGYVLWDVVSFTNTAVYIDPAASIA